VWHRHLHGEMRSPTKSNSDEAPDGGRNPTGRSVDLAGTREVEDLRVGPGSCRSTAEAPCVDPGRLHPQGFSSSHPKHFRMRRGKIATSIASPVVDTPLALTRVPPPGSGLSLCPPPKWVLNAQVPGSRSYLIDYLVNERPRSVCRPLHTERSRAGESQGSSQSWHAQACPRY
jgi:hypothetical protein